MASAFHFFSARAQRLTTYATQLARISFNRFSRVIEKHATVANPDLT
ncbi:MAG: hypothetical protein ABF241_06485 [Yoonia sp.]